MIDYILFFVGFGALIKGADLLVDGSSAFAKRLGISDLVIGLTIVAFGTSMPELVVNLMASYKGNSDIAFGNVVGSNIANILLILGVAAVIYPVTAARSTVRYEIPFSLLAAAALLAMSLDTILDGRASSALSRSDGLILILFFIIFMVYIVGYASKTETEISSSSKTEINIIKNLIFILLGLVGLFFGGQWIVNGATLMARAIGMSEAVIGLTIVAVGTSLPELATSAIAAFKKNSDIAIGNVIGSNIFNIFWILGISTSIQSIPVKPAGMIDLGVLIGVTILLIASLFVGKRFTVQRWQGVLYLCVYAGYTVYLVTNTAR